MIPDDLRRKLEQLNRGPLGIAPAPSRVDPLDAAPVRVEEVVRGEVVGAPERPFFLVQRPLEELLADADALTSEFRRVWVQGRHALTDEDLKGPWSDIIATAPRRLLFLDIETLGLAGTPLFLIGTLYLDADNRFKLRQLFARDYSEEPHILAHLARLIKEYDIIVTYNGKSFDWPYIRDRAVYHSVAMGGDVGHLDLLHEARRRWRTVLPNCQLQTLEYHVSGRRRVGDLPGSLIPEAYHRYVKTGDARQMADVLHHNALDLLTMAELMLFILQGGDLAWE